MLVADKARCMAAADGVVELAAGRPGTLLGLTSVLLLREGNFDLAFVAGFVRWGGRAGEASLEECEFVDEGGPDTLRGRAPGSVLCGMAAGVSWAADLDFESAGGSWGTEPSAGSADSRTPEME